MKKLVLALAATAGLANVASANIGTGFYLGAHTGWDSTRADVNYINGPTGKKEIGRDNPNIGIFAGYGWLCGCFYWGGEIGYTFANIKIRQNATASSTGVVPVVSATEVFELKRNGYFNAAVRLGYLFSQNTMGYVRLGGNYGKWKAMGSLSQTAGAVVTGPFNYAGNKNRFSFAPGVGIETALNRNVSLRAEWSYEFGSNVGATGNTATALNFRSIRSSSMKLGIAYRF